MLQIPGATSYMGSIGKDKFGEEMKKNAQDAGVNVNSWSLFSLSTFFFSSFSRGGGVGLVLILSDLSTHRFALVLLSFGVITW